MLTEKLAVVPVEGTWVVRAGGAVIGETDRALELREGNLPGVVFFPREDIATPFLERSETPGSARALGTPVYYGIAAKSGLIADVAWSFEQPGPGGESLNGFIAFDSRRVTVEQI